MGSPEDGLIRRNTSATLRALGGELQMWGIAKWKSVCGGGKEIAAGKKRSAAISAGFPPGRVPLGSNDTKRQRADALFLSAESWGVARKIDY
jgi:hypothetical protein